MLAPPAGRPDLATAKPSHVQPPDIGRQEERPDDLPTPYSIPSSRRDPLSNTSETSLAIGQCCAAERTDPWLRLVLPKPQAAIVIDLAVLVDGKSFGTNGDS